MLCDAFACVLITWRSLELFTTGPRDPHVLCVDPAIHEWSVYTSYCLSGVQKPPVLEYNSNVVPWPRIAQFHFIRVIANTKLAVCTVMRFLLAAWEGTLSRHRLNTASRIEIPEVLPVLTESDRLSVKFTSPKYYGIFNVTRRCLLRLAWPWWPTTGMNQPKLDTVL